MTGLELLAADLTNRITGKAGEHWDIYQHLPTLAHIAQSCESIVEFGVRTGNSTCAFLYGLETGKGGTLHSFDLNATSLNPPVLEKTKWKFTQANTAQLADIPECDVLFIDTLHTAEQVNAELRHANRVKRFILLHDTVTFGDFGEGDRNKLGITSAIYDFLAENRGWRVVHHYPNNNGLLVLGRA